jgi:hypothetical protein
MAAAGIGMLIGILCSRRTSITMMLSVGWLCSGGKYAGLKDKPHRQISNSDSVDVQKKKPDLAAIHLIEGHYEWLR